MNRARRHQGADATAQVLAMLEGDIAAGMYDGVDILYARHGQIVFHEEVGFADRGASVSLSGHVMCTMSVVKAMTAVVALGLVETGLLSLNEPVAKWLPEFGVQGKNRITLFHLLTHTGGMPWGFPPDVDLGDLSAVVEHASRLQPEFIPGSELVYSAAIGYAVVGELARVAWDPSGTFSDMMEERLFDPLGMLDTAISIPTRLAHRFAPVVARYQGEGSLPTSDLVGLNEKLRRGAEMPAIGAVSTAEDLAKFCLMLRGGGSNNGVRIVSEPMIDVARRIQTGKMCSRVQNAYNSERHGIQPYRANLGLGFWVRGRAITAPPFGVLNSPSTFGIPGVGSTVFWVDPEQDSLLCVLTTGLMESWESLVRFQRISDMVISRDWS